jgi:hypothetical protein
LLLQREEELHQAQEQLGVVDVPEGFKHNDGHIELLCPTSNSTFVTPMWIRRMGDGTIQMRAGREGEEPTYMAELYLEPDYSREPAEPMGEWFLQLL